MSNPPPVRLVVVSMMKFKRERVWAVLVTLRSDQRDFGRQDSGGEEMNEHDDQPDAN